MTIPPDVQRTGSGSRKIPSRSLLILNLSLTVELRFDFGGAKDDSGTLVCR
jgi:hypothetical protein